MWGGEMDVKTAFLHGKLEEELYMEAPAGMNVLKGTVLKLLKSLYGLKQAPRVWNEALNKFIIGQGFMRIHTDRGVYVKVTSNTHMHWRALQDLSKYLTNTKDIGITYGLEDEGAEPNQLYLVMDVDWGIEIWLCHLL